MGTGPKDSPEKQVSLEKEQEPSIEEEQRMRDSLAEMWSLDDDEVANPEPGSLGMVGGLHKDKRSPRKKQQQPALSSVQFPPGWVAPGLDGDDLDLDQFEDPDDPDPFGFLDHAATGATAADAKKRDNSSVDAKNDKSPGGASSSSSWYGSYANDEEDDLLAEDEDVARKKDIKRSPKDPPKSKEEKVKEKKAKKKISDDGYESPFAPKGAASPAKASVKGATVKKTNDVLKAVPPVKVPTSPPPKGDPARGGGGTGRASSASNSEP